MHVHRSAAWLAALFLSAPLAAQDDRPEYLKIEARDRAAVEALARLVDVDSVRQEAGTGYVYAYARPGTAAALGERGYRVERLADPGLNPDPGPDLALWAPLGLWDSYPSWSGYVSMMQGYADGQPVDRPAVVARRHHQHGAPARDPGR